MNTLIANACWPNRFLATWLASFFGAVAFGMAVGAILLLLRPDVQANIEVYDSNGRSIPAQVYFARTEAEMRPDKLIEVTARAAAKRTQKSGFPIFFMVQPVDANKKPIQNPEAVTVTWPEREGAFVPLRLTQAYPAALPAPRREEPTADDPPVAVKPPQDVTPKPAPKPPATTDGPKPPAAKGYDWLLTRAVTEADMEGKSVEELRRMKNWPFAKRGRQFKNPDLQAYYEKNMPGYEGTSFDVTLPPGSIESKNAMTLDAKIKEMGG